MARGKKTCKILKEIRRQIAEANDIEYVVEECQYKGDCLGTCPKCEAEVRYLEQQLHQRQLLGKAVVLAGVSVGMFTLSSCNSNSKTMGETTNDTTKVFYDIENGTMGISEPIDVYEYPKIKIEKLSNYESLKIKVEGEIKNGKREGYGRYIMNDGNYYIGQFNNGLRQGKGAEDRPGGSGS